ncbi:MAG TPA: hypothetical protein VFL14_11180 [Xanthomonadales bacterium]|nr:hypothetical protein [Xanthomonadales bacterium]
MNARPIVLALALVASLSSFAASATSEPGSLRWECARQGAPSHREIATAFGYDNYQYMREAQPRLYRELRRECTRSGADAVLLVLDAAKHPKVQSLAAN